MTGLISRVWFGLVLIGSIRLGVCADISGTWVGSWKVGGQEEGVCLALISGEQTFTAEVAYHQDREYEIVTGRSAAGDLDIELSDSERGPIRLKLSNEGLSFVGNVLIGDRSGSVLLKKYIRPLTSSRFGKTDDSPRLIRTGRPTYTDSALLARIEGSVLLDVQILSNGAVGGDIRLVRGLGFGLDEKAIEAVKGWIFSPPHENCRPGFRMRVEVEFRLP